MVPVIRLPSPYWLKYGSGRTISDVQIMDDHPYPYVGQPYTGRVQLYGRE